MIIIRTLFLVLPIFLSLIAQGAGKHFDHSLIVIFENTNYAKAIQQPYLKQLADQGAHFSDFLALTHPSQGNYIALTSGSLHNVKGDGSVDIDALNIADLLEAKGLTWKVYAEDYPGNCFEGPSNGKYARKHNPFISYLNIQRNPARCANIVDAGQFEIDVAKGLRPNYTFYIPNEDNDGHDTGVAFADKWYQKKFSKYFEDPRFMEKTVVISTFDESGFGPKNQIYTSIFGPSVKPGIIGNSLNIYSLLKMIEENWSLGSLNLEDEKAVSVPNIWR